MKKMRKILAMVLAIVMVLGMGTMMTFAAGTNTITVKNGYAGQTYTLYKIFNATTNAARQAATDADENNAVLVDGINYTLPTGKSLATEYTYTDSNGTSHTVKGENWFAVDSAGNVTAVAGADVSTEEFREWAKQFGTQVGDAQTVGATNADVTFSTLEDGYYFVTTTTGTLVTVDSVAPNAIIKDKNEVPTIDKTVTGGTATGSDTAATNQETNTASIGDVLTFTATIHAKPNAKTYVFEDTMASGLTLQKFNDTLDVSVKVGNEDLTAGTDYTLTTFDASASPQIKITFKQSYLDSITANTDIVIQYKAQVNKNAVIAGDGNNNTATLKYGDNGTDVTDSTTTYVYQFGLYKTATINSVAHTILTGAKFKLYDAATGGNEIPLVLDNGVYRPALTGETAVVIDAGTATISGLKNGTYYLEETDAPAGYNKLTARQSITITDSNNTGTVTGGVYNNDGGLEVINQSGSVLPSTGGIGTTIFYIIGGILVLGAGILLIARRRMSAEKED